MKKLIALLLVFSMLLSLAACGKADPNLGKYNIVRSVYVTEDGTEEEATPDGEWVELEKGGKGTYYSGFEFKLNWSAKDGSFEGKVSFLGVEETMTGTIGDGILEVRYGDYKMTFAKDGANYVAPSVPETTTEATEETEEVTEATEDTTAPDAEGGIYPIYSMELNGTALDYAELQMMELDGTTLELRDDGTAVLTLAGEDPEECTVDWDNGTIVDSTGEDFAISREGDFITVHVENDSLDMTLVFAPESVERTTTADNGGDDNGSDVGTSDGTVATSIELDTDWYGLVAITGDDPRLVDAYGVIGTETSTGKTYFEIFTDDDEETPLISMYCEISNDVLPTIVPVIGDNDAWAGDTFLSAGDEAAYSAYLVNGALYASMSDGDALYAVILRLYGDTWEGETTLPPGFDEYIASLN